MLSVTITNSSLIIGTHFWYCYPVQILLLVPIPILSLLLVPIPDNVIVISNYIQCWSRYQLPILALLLVLIPIQTLLFVQMPDSSIVTGTDIGT